jgi:hypothetical protein
VTPFGFFLMSFALNDIVAKHLAIAAVAPDTTADAWLLSLHWPEDPEQRARQADIAAYLLHGYWRHGRTQDIEATLDDLQMGAQVMIGSDVRTSADMPLSEAITATVAMSRFLHGGYTEALRPSFLAGYIMGSLGYGAFYSTGQSSDIDVFLVAPDGPIDATALCGGQEMDQSGDRPDRLAYFADAAAASEGGILNYKLRPAGFPFELSLNLVTLSALRHICALDSSKNSVLYWHGAFGDAPLLARDFAGRDQVLPFTEGISKFGNRLTVPNFTRTEDAGTSGLGVFCPLATMPMPCFEALFTAPAVERTLSAFLLDVERLRTDFAAEGLAPEYGNLHIRQDRFSPWLRRKTTELFPFLLSPMA